MVLEAVVLIVDNSEWMRNGDFSPSRYDAQFDTCNLICGQRSEDNAQSSLALITSAGDRSEVKVTLTDDIGEIITALHRVKDKIGGKCNFAQSLKIGQLVLNHTRNPHQALRIITFIGSPIFDTETELVEIAEILRKNKISLDIISFGETEVNDSKLELLFKTISKESGGSSLIKVPPGLGVSLSDFLRQTPILASIGNVNQQGETNEFGVNPNMDPELYLAMQLSREDYDKTQTPGDNTQVPPLVPDEDVNMYDDDEVEKAIKLSLQTGAMDEVQPEGGTKTETKDNTKPTNPSIDQNEQVDISKITPEFLQELFGKMEGVDLTNPEILQLIAQFKQQQNEQQKEQKKEDKKD